MGKREDDYTVKGLYEDLTTGGLTPGQKLDLLRTLVIEQAGVRIETGLNNLADAVRRSRAGAE